MAQRGERKDDKEPEKVDDGQSMFESVADAVYNFVAEHGTGSILKNRGRQIDDEVNKATDPEKKKRK